MAAEEWRQCVDWLVRCEILPPDHKVMQPGAAVFDLAQTLRDGVLLCQLLIKLRRRAIEQDFSLRPQMSQFLCLKNIRTFLQTCKSEFELDDNDLFNCHDLFDLRDFGTVIRTLSILSKSKKAQESGIEGFPNDIGNRDRHADDEELYKNLEELAAEMPDEDIYGQVIGEDEQEKVYEDLLSIRPRAAQSITQSLTTSAQHQIQRASTASIGGAKTKKEYCIEEILGTEKNYVDLLDTINKYFIQPLRTVLEDQSRDLIFSIIEKLLPTHRQIHGDLAKVSQQYGHNLLAQGLVQRLADVFVKYKMQLVFYGDYCAQLPRAQALVDDLMAKNDHVRQKILDQQQLANNGKFKLRDLLAVPMQRVLKYPLLLRELMKHTDKQAPSEDRTALDKALEAMLDLSLYVNEVKRDKEALETLSYIQNSITDLKMPENTELKDYGRLLKDGDLRVKDHESNKDCRRYIFLFDKVMMMCKSKMVHKYLSGDTYSFKNALILPNFHVEDGAAISANSAKGSTKAPEKWRHVFMLVEQNNQCAYTFYAKSDKMKQEWIDAIKLALDNYLPPGAKEGGHDFLMRCFPQPTQCDHCGKLLRGCFYQGYLCTVTKKVAHKECIAAIVRETVSLLNRPLPTKRVKATHSYKGIPPAADGKSVLCFNFGDIIDVINDSDPNWWQGRLDKQVGFFPSTYVEPQSRDTRKSRPPMSSYEQTNITHPNGRPSLSKQPSGGGLGTGRASSIDSATAGGCGGLSSPRLEQRLASAQAFGSLVEQPWYVGRMSRDHATHCLQNVETGVFLVRESENQARRGEYALSLKYMGSVKHIKVNRNEADSTYYLADCKFFRSLIELVEYYKLNSLESSFPEVRSTLLIAYKDATASPGEFHLSPVQSRPSRTLSENGVAVGYGSQGAMARTPTNIGISAAARRSLPPVLSYALASYDYASTEPNQISLKCNDRVAIVSKAGGEKGWWKGYVVDVQGNPSGRVGFFPLAYVEEDEA